MAQKTSRLINLNIYSKCPGFFKIYVLDYLGEDFLVISRSSRFVKENLTIIRTSDRCIKLIRTVSNISQSNYRDCRSFRTVTQLCAYLNKLVIN